MPKVSAIVAIYNSEKFLKKLIDSLINQTYKDLEIILVDDGSPDKSGEICDDYAQIDNRILVIHKKNGGTCEARNVGLSVATGDYVVIIDGDDWLELDYIEYMMQLTTETGSDMGMSVNVFTTRNREQIENDQIETWTSEEAAIAIIYPRFPIGPWNKIYNLDLLRKNNINFSVPWSGEGLYFSVTAAQYANHVGVGYKKVYNYRLNNTESGLTHYNLQMGINALENIKYIGENLQIRTPRIVNAINWHIWKNYGYELFLIIATNSKNENFGLYKDCIRNIRRRLVSVLIHSEVDLKMKVKMLVQGIFPVMWSKRELRKAKNALEKDTME